MSTLSLAVDDSDEGMEKTDVPQASSDVQLLQETLLIAYLKLLFAMARRIVRMEMMRPTLHAQQPRPQYQLRSRRR